MHKSILAAAIFSLSMLANAQSADVAVSSAEPQKATESEDVQVHSGMSITKDGNTGCIKETGSHLKKSKDKNGCNGEPGRSYDKDDIDRTGANTVGEALERLDPSIRISR